MLYFKLNEHLEVIAISSGFPAECKFGQAQWARGANNSFGAGWLDRWDISSNPAPRMFAQVLADSASKFSGKQYLMADRGPDCSPRYDVIEAPQAGDDVSMAFNGDYYPVGKVVKIGKDYKQIKVEGERGEMVFYRKKESGAWLYKQMWSLVPGVINRWNPEF